MYCQDPPIRLGSVLCIHVQLSKRNPLFYRCKHISDTVHRGAGVTREGQEKAQAESGGVTTESVLFEMIFPLVYFSALLCPVSQSLLRLCSSVQEPFLKVMSSTAISPLLPRPRSPFRITWWTVEHCTLSYSHWQKNVQLYCHNADCAFDVTLKTRVQTSLFTIVKMSRNNMTKFNNWCLSKLCYIIIVRLTLSRSVPHKVIWVCLQPLPPVRPHTAGLYCFPFFTNTWSIPTWCPASLCRKDRHRLPSFQGGVSGSTSRAPRPVLLFPVSGIVRYRPPVETNKGDYGQLM